MNGQTTLKPRPIAVPVNFLHGFEWKVRRTPHPKQSATSSGSTNMRLSRQMRARGRRAVQTRGKFAPSIPIIFLILGGRILKVSLSGAAFTHLHYARGNIGRPRPIRQFAMALPGSSTGIGCYTRRMASSARSSSAAKARLHHAPPDSSSAPCGGLGVHPATSAVSNQPFVVHQRVLRRPSQRFQQFLGGASRHPPASQSGDKRERHQSRGSGDTGIPQSTARNHLPVQEPLAYVTARAVSVDAGSP